MFYPYTGFFADIEVNIAFRFPETGGFYGSYVSPSALGDNFICIPEYDMKLWKKRWNAPVNAQTEFSLSPFFICQELLKKKKAVFHGVAMLFHDQVILFTGPSGVGKTTQYRHWKEQFGEKITVLNGDKPILSVEENGEVLVYSSPWKGKEKYGKDGIHAPLSCIIFLRQDDHNAIRQLKPEESIPRLMGRILVPLREKETVENACQFMDELLIRIPVFYLQNTGTSDSAIMTYDALWKEGIIRAV